jgi:tripeptide aminopeptidase
MSLIQQLASQPLLQQALQWFHQEQKAAVDLAIQIQQIPAPTFAEGVRANFVQRQFQQLGLEEVAQDELCNVYGRYRGQDPSRPPVIISAHTDTVFPAGTNLNIRREGNRIYGPGLADNSAGVAGLIMLGQALRAHGLRPQRDIWLVANIAEEGLGDLKGMRAVVERFGRRATYLVLEGGSFGHLVHRAIGVKRFRLDVRAQGGHSWADFGQTSAIHVLGRLIAAIADVAVPAQPKTTYNVGIIEGGTSINTIAETASLLLDLRSEGPSELARLEQQVRQIVAVANTQPNQQIRLTQIGDRPAGELAAESPLLGWATDALRLMEWPHPGYAASSTDANIPLSLGCEALCIGLSHSGNVHRLDEYFDTTHFPRGLGQLLLLTLATAEWQL